MTPEQWKKVRYLFEQALELPVQERVQFVRHESQGDVELRGEVCSLLEHYEDSGNSFLETTTAQPQASERGRSENGGSTEHSRPVEADAFDAPESYEVIREVGRGGMGRVYLARDKKLNRNVAIKTIAAADLSPQHLDLFTREAQLTANLRHQNIVTLYSFSSSGSTPFFVMEWIDGDPLHEYCRRRRLSIDDSVRLLERIARALAYAHTRRVIHRDLKPQNILVDGSGEPRILDFGLARLAATVAEGSSIGEPVKGTPQYMAPEQVADPEEVGPAADIFALGLIMYELLTGVPPPKPPAMTDHKAWKCREIPLLRDINADIPESLQRICLKATEPTPGNRYQSADHFADDLRRYLDNRPITTRPTRYARLLEGRVREHIDVLSGWHQENLISHRELDMLQDKYLGLLRAESLWVPGARRLRTGPILTQLGGWLLVVSAVLWPKFYWDYQFGHNINLAKFGRVFFEAIPTIIVNAGAFRLWKRGNKLNALIFTVTGVLLVPICLAVMLGVGGVFAWRRGNEYEVFPEKYFSNTQVTLAISVALGYGIWWLRRRPYALLSMVVALLAALFWASILFCLGMMKWLNSNDFAFTALCWVPFLVVVLSVARRLDRPAWEHLAVPYYAAAAISFVLITATLAWDAPKSWLHLGSAPATTQPANRQVDPLQFTQGISLFGCGLAYLLVALLLDRSRSRLRRLWGAIIFRIVPPVCLLSWDWLGDQPIRSWTHRLHHGEVYFLTPIEVSVPILCFGLAAVAMRFQLRWFLYYSLIHLAWFIFRTTERFLQDNFAWPFSLLGIGIVALIAGLLIEYRRLMAARPETPSPSP
ncbi:MAG: serine/threonine protein kinase [Phycisphaerae bacterium]|nr:serine/threonine protein kinase [Phycisphaerae bacterium]